MGYWPGRPLKETLEREKSQTAVSLIKRKIDRKRSKPHGFREIARRENKKKEWKMKEIEGGCE